MISANTKNLIHAISIDGKVADRYFAVTSEVPKNTVDARISAMPLNGRSARAGAVRASGLFSGNGNEALSSLAAAAGGGGTAISKAAIIESGEALKNANCAGTTRSENGTPICARPRGSPPQPMRRLPSPARPLPSPLQHFVNKCVRYSIGKPRGFGPRGKAFSSAASSLSLRLSLPAAALSAACSALEAFGIANTEGVRV